MDLGDSSDDASKLPMWASVIGGLTIGGSAFVVRELWSSSVHIGYMGGLLVGALGTLLIMRYQSNRMLEKMHEDAMEAVDHAGDTAFRVGMLAVYENKVPDQIIEQMTEGIELGDAKLDDPEAAAQAGIDVEELDLEEMDDDENDRMFQ